ncbi:MAG: hypothetical protein K0M60_10320 [Hydrogenophaga sp.]|nr:hypothetical protein [Hydrogenophaga sp.]
MSKTHPADLDAMDARRLIGRRRLSPSIVPGDTRATALMLSITTPPIGSINSFTAICLIRRGVDVRFLSPELDFGFSIITARQRPISQIA